MMRPCPNSLPGPAAEMHKQSFLRELSHQSLKLDKFLNLNLKNF